MKSSDKKIEKISEEFTKDYRRITYDFIINPQLTTWKYFWQSEKDIEEKLEILRQVK